MDGDAQRTAFLAAELRYGDVGVRIVGCTHANGVGSFRREIFGDENNVIVRHNFRDLESRRTGFLRHSAAENRHQDRKQAQQ